MTAAMSTLMALCEKTSNDIRSCLNTLQVFTNTSILAVVSQRGLTNKCLRTPQFCHNFILRSKTADHFRKVLEGFVLLDKPEDRIALHTRYNNNEM